MDSGFDMLGQFQGGQAFQTEQRAIAGIGPAKIQVGNANKLKLGVQQVNYLSDEIQNKDD